MFKKIGIILANFFKSAKGKELFDLLIIPVIIIILIYLFLNNKISDISKFANAFNDSVVNVTSLLAAFGLATLSILVTSSGENITASKQQNTNRKDRNKKIITYYKLLILRNFYSLFLQLLLLIISIINKFIIEINNIILLESVAYLEFYLLLCSIFAQIFVVNSMYFIFISSKKE